MEPRELPSVGRTADSDAPVVLVNMPFASLEYPSLALGLFKASLARIGVRSRVLHLGFDMAAHIAPQLYRAISFGMHKRAMIGEWLFTDAVWGPDAARDEAWRAVVLAERPPHAALNDGALHPEALYPDLCRARAAIPAFLDRCMSAHDWSVVRLVGFSSMFQQHLASLAFARRLKERHPHVTIAFGGANCEGPMGRTLLRAFSFIDAVCIGEGDTAFPAYAQQVIGHDPSPPPRGLLVRPRLPRSLPVADGEPPGPAPIEELDALPFPDYDDFFAARAGFAPAVGVPGRIVFETSRGCWWGEKSHCTFCGLNPGTMRFRSKSADRALAELRWLVERYGKSAPLVGVVDNIMPLDYFRSFLPRLSDLGLGVELFYETKSNLREEHVRACRDAGVRVIQPGIESLSTPVLELMRKGVTAIQNIQLLKWCRAYGVWPQWNMLIGFPGERREHYASLPELVRAIAHLPPPQGCSVVRFDRFSPYVESPEQFGIRDLAPLPVYDYLYPGLAPSERRGMAYYFAGQFEGADHLFEYASPLIGAVDAWCAQEGSAALFYEQAGDAVTVWDTRPAAAEAKRTLSGLPARLLLATERLCRRHMLGQAFAADGEDAVRGALVELAARRLVIEEGDHLLGLGIRLSSGWTPPPKVLLHLRRMAGLARVAQR